MQPPQPSEAILAAIFGTWKTRCRQITKRIRQLQRGHNRQREPINQERERERKQCEFLKKCTLADVLLDAEYPKAFKGSTGTAALQSIKGVCPNLLGCNFLHHFMIVNKLTYIAISQRSEMCRMIVERK
jgi:hypothetical protein